MLEKKTVVNKIEILEDGTIQIREAIRIMEDGKGISQSFRRSIIRPGDDASKADSRVKAVVNAVHIKSVIDAYKAKLEKETNHATR